MHIQTFQVILFLLFLKPKANGVSVSSNTNYKTTSVANVNYTGHWVQMQFPRAVKVAYFGLKRISNESDSPGNFSI
jgi:hypothetical protein